MPASTDAMSEWENQTGLKFLRAVGLREGDRVLDFGARVGHYSLPAAGVVGATGSVHALDKDEFDLRILEEKAQARSLANIVLEMTGGELALAFQDAFFDVVLAYDVLHYLDLDDRQTLYQEFRRVLKPEGLFSVYPKHTKDDWPLMTLREVSVTAVQREIEAAGFRFVDRYCGEISHDDWMDEGCVLNFRASGTTLGEERLEVLNSN